MWRKNLHTTFNLQPNCERSVAVQTMALNSLNKHHELESRVKIQLFSEEYLATTYGFQNRSLLCQSINNEIYYCSKNKTKTQFTIPMVGQYEPCFIHLMVTAANLISEERLHKLASLFVLGKRNTFIT